MEDITAAMLSSVTHSPCHSRQAGWRRDAKMFVDLCGWMSFYIRVCVCVFVNTLQLPSDLANSNEWMINEWDLVKCSRTNGNIIFSPSEMFGAF